MKIKLFILFLLANSIFYAQKKTYTPITNTTVEEIFPLLHAYYKINYKVEPIYFDYGNGSMIFSRYYYFRGLAECRAYIRVSVNDNGICEIDFVDVEKKTNGEWYSAGESLLSKTEKNMKATDADALRELMKNKSVMEDCRATFFTDLNINMLFCETATSLAMDRWFEKFLKGKKIEWSATFRNIDVNNNPNVTYKYVEHYTFRSGSNVSSSRHAVTFMKYTNDDSNVLTSNGEEVILNGYCRSMEVVEGGAGNNFEILLTNSLNSPQPEKKQEVKTNKSIKEIAEELKALKELLDLGAITQDEYDIEKAKILSQR